MVKLQHGIYLPDGDTHFATHLERGPIVDGKCTYQFAKIEEALKHTKKRRVALDIGAHVGLWSRILAMHFERVIAFEPLAEHVVCFRLNTADRRNVELHDIALGNHDGGIRMNPILENSGNAHVLSSGAIEVCCSRLDTLMDSYLLSLDIDFIKIDVEGFEETIINGAENTIRKHKPILVVEQKPGNAERYGLNRLGAVNLLHRWGAKVIWEKNGDYCLGWE